MPIITQHAMYLRHIDRWFVRFHVEILQELAYNLDEMGLWCHVCDESGNHTLANIAGYVLQARLDFFHELDLSSIGT